MPYVLNRKLWWNGKNVELTQDSKTTEKSPQNDDRKQLQQLLDENKPEETLRWCELLFATGSATLWLDLQRTIDESARALGEKFAPVSECVRVEVAKLLQQIPNITELKFNNTVRFADDKTVDWITESVLPHAQAGGQTALHAQTASANTDETEAEMAEARKLLKSKGLAAAVEVIKQGFSKDGSHLGRFKRQLHMTTLCVEDKNYLVALPILRDLDQQIEDSALERWLPELCIAVWNNLRICAENVKGHGTFSDSEKEEVKSLAKKAFEKVSRLDITQTLNFKSS